MTKRNLKKGLLATLLVIVATGIYYFPKMQSHLAKHIIQSDTQKIIELKGKMLDRALKVTAFGQTQQQSLSELVPQAHILMIYADWCSPCKSLAHAYKNITNHDAPPLYLLSFNANDLPPVGFPTSQFLIAHDKRANTVFTGKSFPVLWYFDNSGLVLDVKVGFDELNFNSWVLHQGNDEFTQ